MTAMTPPCLPKSFHRSQMRWPLMRTNGARGVVEMTPPWLLDELLGYFGQALIKYAVSWQTLSAASTRDLADGVWEVLVLREAVLSAEIVS